MISGNSWVLFSSGCCLPVCLFSSACLLCWKEMGCLAGTPRPLPSARTWVPFTQWLQQHHAHPRKGRVQQDATLGCPQALACLQRSMVPLAVLHGWGLGLPLTLLVSPPWAALAAPEADNLGPVQTLQPPTASRC